MRDNHFWFWGRLRGKKLKTKKLSKHEDELINYVLFPYELLKNPNCFGLKEFAFEINEDDLKITKISGITESGNIINFEKFPFKIEKAGYSYIKANNEKYEKKLREIEHIENQLAEAKKNDDKLKIKEFEEILIAAENALSNLCEYQLCDGDIINTHDGLLIGNLIWDKDNKKFALDQKWIPPVLDLTLAYQYDTAFGKTLTNKINGIIKLISGNKEIIFKAWHSVTYDIQYAIWADSIMELYKLLFIFKRNFITDDEKFCNIPPFYFYKNLNEILFRFHELIEFGCAKDIYENILRAIGKNENDLKSLLGKAYDNNNILNCFNELEDILLITYKLIDNSIDGMNDLNKNQVSFFEKYFLIFKKKKKRKKKEIYNNSII